MTEQILLSLSINDLRILITDAVINGLPASGGKIILPTEIINRVELCRRLAITEPTAIRWENKGKIPAFRIGSSVRYNWATVISKLEGKIKGSAQ